MSKSESIRSAISLAEKVGHVFVATADAKGMPHVAAAAKIERAQAGHVTLAAWFCPGTVLNLQQNRRIALVIWDRVEDIGYQLLGKVEKVEEMAMLDGYAPEVETAQPMPQVERQLLVRVDKILSFTHAPHTDEEE